MATSPRVFAGYAADLPFETFLRGSGTVKARYAAGDVIAAHVYQSRVENPIFRADATWYSRPDASGLATQTGYDQGEVSVRFTGDQAALLVPGIIYTLQVTWSPALDPTQSAPIVVRSLLIRNPKAN